MDRYIEMLLKIKDSVHIERLLNEPPTWIEIAFIIALIILGVGFALMLVTQMAGSRSNSDIVWECVAMGTSSIGVLATTVLSLIHI